MDIVIKRFPLVSCMVLKNLDDQTLIRSKEASRQMAQFLENKGFYLILIIKKYKGNFEGLKELWKEVIRKTPIDAIKQLALATQQFFVSNSLLKEMKVAPLHIVVEKGTLELFQFILSKGNNKNPDTVR